MKISFDHVAGVVPDVAAAAAAFEAMTGRGPIHAADGDPISIRAMDLGNAELHLVSGPFPLGLHHIGLRVDDIDAAVAELGALGFRMRGEVAVLAPGVREVYLEPETAAGFLVQLVEKSDPVDEAG